MSRSSFEASKRAYEKALKSQGKGRGAAITTEIRAAADFETAFYYAEDYHQQYLAKPGAARIAVRNLKRYHFRHSRSGHQQNFWTHTAPGYQRSFGDNMVQKDMDELCQSRMTLSNGT